MTNRENIFSFAHKYPFYIDNTISENFIIVYSKNLDKKIRTSSRNYVSREINAALDRQKYIIPGTLLSYILPIKLDDCEFIADLTEIQYIDLSLNKYNIEELIKSIEKDKQIRKDYSQT